MFPIFPLSTPSLVHDPGAKLHPRRPAVFALQQVCGAIGAWLARLGALTYDSREGLPSKEQQVAALGISWATDAAYDAELAQELADARLRRRKGVAVATPAQPEVPGTKAEVGPRWSVRAHTSASES